jgi:NAD(P)-dependent dehydrogenase (short-subunit alcohol dehydrogenase family)
MQIKNAVALVTGANRGLGLTFVQQLLDRGARKVYGAARDPSNITMPGVVPLRLNVTRPEQIEAAAREANDVTLLINNAGIAGRTKLLGEDALALARDQIETNYLGPFAMARAFAPVLAKNGGGAIVNVLSVRSWFVIPETVTYGASKAAGWALTNGLRQELRDQKTQVLALHVDYIDTEMAKRVDAPKTSPIDVVRQTLDALEAGRDEVLADEVTRNVKRGLSAEPGIYLDR